MKHKDIICISMTTWEGDYMKTIVHMMSELAGNHRVMFVDYAFTWKDLVYSFMGRGNAPVKRMLGLKPRLRRLETSKGQIIDHLTLPPVLPINWIRSAAVFDFFRKIQSIPVIGAIQRATAQLEYDNPLMINAFHPVMGVSLKNKIKASGIIYYCYDEIRAAKWASNHGGRYESLFMPMTDGVIVTSEGLLDGRSSLHENVTLIKNGVDFDLFHQAFRLFKNNPKPVIGYLGSIDDRLDYPLLEAVISQAPGYSFHFVGRVTYPRGKGLLGKYPNVSFFGAQAPTAIPDFLSKFDVGLIPFVKNEFTKNIYPLKINEYLAAAVPVIATNFADLTDFEGHITLADTVSDFRSAIIDAMSTPTTTSVTQRVAIAQSNGWEKRALKVEAFLKQIIESKQVYAC